MKALLLVESVNQTDPQSTAKQDAENCNNDGVGLGAAVFRVIEAGTAVIDVFAVHERTSERAHAQQYAVPGMPCQPVRNKLVRLRGGCPPGWAKQEAESP